jgi:cellulose synthase/poly-beta-1,6-N-acetylglucosamine synthase-like glycosyltransferase
MVLNDLHSPQAIFQLLLSVLGMYYAAANLSYLILMIASFKAFRSNKKNIRTRDQQIQFMIRNAAHLPKVSIIVPAFNEQDVICASVSSFLAVHYPNFEIIVVNDGSSDQTESRLRSCFALRPSGRMPVAAIGTGVIQEVSEGIEETRLIYIKQVNGGKACALNTGLRYASGDLICTVDADTIPTPDCLLKLVRVFLFDDARIAAASGTVRIVNGCRMDAGRQVLRGTLPKNHLAMFQILEYIRAFYAGRMGWEQLGATALLSGAFTMFNRVALLTVKGFSEANITEDFEVSLRVRAHLKRSGQPCITKLIPDPICWTLAPESLGDLRRQRRRWHLGGLLTMWSYRWLFLNPRYGTLGLCVIPYMVLFELLSPIVELLSYAAVGYALMQGIINYSWLLSILVIGLGFSFVVGVVGLFLEESMHSRHRALSNLRRLMIFTMIEPFGYRQFQTLWRLEAFFRFWFDRKSWGAHKKRRFSEQINTSSQISAPDRSDQHAA